MTPGDDFEPMIKAWRETIDRADLIVTGVEVSMLEKLTKMNDKVRSEFDRQEYDVKPPLKLLLFRRIHPPVEPESK
jgi:hypothetical protein